MKKAMERKIVKENEERRRDNECVVCLDAEANCLFLFSTVITSRCVWVVRNGWTSVVCVKPLSRKSSECIVNV